jgi:hypothetical protein
MKKINNFWKKKYIRDFHDCNKILNDEEWKINYYEKNKIEKIKEEENKLIGNELKNFNLFDLPYELIIMILEKFDDHTLLKFSKICKKINYRNEEIELSEICQPIWSNRIYKNVFIRFYNVNNLDLIYFDLKDDLILIELKKILKKLSRSLIKENWQNSIRLSEEYFKMFYHMKEYMRRKKWNKTWLDIKDQLEFQYNNSENIMDKCRTSYWLNKLFEIEKR